MHKPNAKKMFILASQYQISNMNFVILKKAIKRIHEKDVTRKFNRHAFIHRTNINTTFTNVR